jgi:hypothetical protein
MRKGGLAAFVAAASMAGIAVLPGAAGAQFTNPPWDCKPIKRVGEGWSGWKTHHTWAPNIGWRVYKISYTAVAEECGRSKTRIRHMTSWRAKSLDRKETVEMQYGNAGPHKIWAGTKTYKIQGGTDGPRFGASPLVQYRGTPGRAYVKYARITYAAFSGNWLAGKPTTVTLRLRQYRRR